MLRYAGCCYDEPSGLYYLSQRYYDPQTMCFLSKDPARADGEQSAYQYCGGDPVGKVDPSGEWKKEAHHFAWTKHIAWKGLGLPEYIAWLIAKGCRYVDEGPSMISYRWWIDGRNWTDAPGYKYHFNAYTTLYAKDWDDSRLQFKWTRGDSRQVFASKFKAEAERTWRSGTSNRVQRASYLLGYGSHCLQDIYAHGNVKHHAPWVRRSTYFDDPGKKTWRATNAKGATKRYIASFRYLAQLKSYSSANWSMY